MQQQQQQQLQYQSPHMQPLLAQPTQFVQQQHYVQGQPAALPYNYILSPTAPQQNQLEYIYPGNAASPNAAASMNSQHVQGNVTTTIPTHSSTPYLIPAVASRKKESVVVRVDDSTEMIRIQAQRIARLEERCDLLTKQYQRYITSLEYKDQEINHWQERCNIMQSHLETPYKRIEELQIEKNEVKRDQERMQKVVQSGVDEYNALEALKLQKQNDVKFWKERAKKAEKTQTIIMSLEHRVKMLQTENERLNQLIARGSKSNPPVNVPVWQNN